MDWTNNGNRPAQPAPAGGGGTHKKKKLALSNMRFASVALLFSVTALILALAYFLAVGKSSREADFIDDSKLQAVFLNGGQVYFGKLDDLNSNYLRMSNIYYLRVNQTVQPDQENGSQQQATANDISLVKLGCELHGPEDSMVINHDQVIFWENLKSDGQVAKAVDEYVKANPNGQQCNTNSGSGSNTNTNSESNTNTTTPTTNTNTNTNSNTRR